MIFAKLFVSESSLAIHGLLESVPLNLVCNLYGKLCDMFPFSSTLETESWLHYLCLFIGCQVFLGGWDDHSDGIHSQCLHGRGVFWYIIVLSNNMVSLDILASLVSSAWYSSRVTHRFFFKPWVYWLNSLGTFHLTYCKCRLNSRVYVAVDLVYVGFWIAFLAFAILLVSKNMASKFYKHTPDGKVWIVVG